MAEIARMGVVIEAGAVYDLRVRAAQERTSGSRLARNLVVAFLRGEIELPGYYYEQDADFYDYEPSNGSG